MIPFKVIICKSCFSDFVHRLYFNKITTFRPGLRLAQPGGPTARVLSFLFTWRRKKIQLPKRSNFIKIQTMDKVQKTAFTDYNAPSSEPFRVAFEKD
jgi:hypothetical protein